MSLRTPTPTGTHPGKIKGPGDTGKTPWMKMEERALGLFRRETLNSYGVTGNALNAGICASRAKPTAGAVVGKGHGYQRIDSVGTGECVTTSLAPLSTQ